MAVTSLRRADKDLKARWRERFRKLPPSARRALADALSELRADALERAETQWRRHKAPMAVYWKVVGVYAGHLARAVRAADRGGDRLEPGEVEVRYREDVGGWTELDEIVARGVDVHVEKLDNDIFWMALYRPGTMDERDCFTFSTTRSDKRMPRKFVEGRHTEVDMRTRIDRPAGGCIGATRAGVGDG